MTEKVATQLKEVYDKGRTAKYLSPQGHIPDLGWNTDQQGRERQQLPVETQPEATVTQTTPDQGEGPPSSWLRSKTKATVVLLHRGCLSLIPFNPFNKFRIWNNSSSPDVLNVQASISISPNYVSKSKTTSHCQLLLHDCTNAAV